MTLNSFSVHNFYTDSFSSNIHKTSILGRSRCTTSYLTIFKNQAFIVVFTFENTGCGLHLVA